MRVPNELSGVGGFNCERGSRLQLSVVSLLVERGCIYVACLTQMSPIVFEPVHMTGSAYGGRCDYQTADPHHNWAGSHSACSVVPQPCAR